MNGRNTPAGSISSGLQLLFGPPPPLSNSPLDELRHFIYMCRSFVHQNCISSGFYVRKTSLNGEIETPLVVFYPFGCNRKQPTQPCKVLKPHGRDWQSRCAIYFCLEDWFTRRKKGLMLIELLGRGNGSPGRAMTTDEVESFLMLGCLGTWSCPRRGEKE